MNIKIIIASHKPYWMPDSDIYVPLQVGSEEKETISGFQRDNEGENISAKNGSYCELTGLYWAWKNLDADYIGLVHYRRYFAKRSWGRKHTRIAGRSEIEQALKHADVLLPKPRHYFIETNYSQYIHAHYEQDLIIARQIISEKYSDYIPAWDLVMKRSSGHRFNMFIMKRSIINDYLLWLFDILFELEERLDISCYSKRDARVFGFVAERLLDIWILHHRIRYAELPVVHLESQHWPIKTYLFLKRKFAKNAVH